MPGASAPVSRRPARVWPPRLAAALVVATVLTGCSSSSAPSNPSSGLQVSGTANGWVFHDGQTVKVSMGPNKIFTPYVRLNIIQCADPDGTTANLPTTLANCDATTVQGDSLIPAKDGSFSESAYPIYQLPSATLGENKTNQPVCNATHKCVLFVGEDFNNFHKPKVFSEPFTVGTGSGS